MLSHGKIRLNKNDWEAKIPFSPYTANRARHGFIHLAIQTLHSDQSSEQRRGKEAKSTGFNIGNCKINRSTNHHLICGLEFDGDFKSVNLYPQYGRQKAEREEGDYPTVKPTTNCRGKKEQKSQHQQPKPFCRHPPWWWCQRWCHSPLA